MIAIFKSTQPQVPHFIHENVKDARFLGRIPDHSVDHTKCYYVWEVNTTLDAYSIYNGVQLNPYIVDYGVDILEDNLPTSSPLRFNSYKNYRALLQEANELCQIDALDSAIMVL